MEGMRGSEEEGTGVDKSAEDMQQIVLKALRINPMLTSHSACRLYPMLPDPPPPPPLPTLYTIISTLTTSSTGNGNKWHDQCSASGSSLQDCHPWGKAYHYHDTF